MAALSIKSLVKLSLATITVVSAGAFAETDLAPQTTDTAEVVGEKCPNHFFNVSLPDNGKLCQAYAQELPASMILFVPQKPQDVVAFYQSEQTTFTQSKEVKGRTILQSADKQTTLIISADGEGSQVDILVKS